MPGTVTVSEGSLSASFAVQVGQVYKTATRSVTASLNGVTRTAFITLHSGLIFVGANPDELTGGSPVTGTLQLAGDYPPHPGVIAEVWDSSAAITTPPTVTITSTATSFSITTSQVSADAVRFVFASLGGVTRSKALRLTVGPRLQSLTVNPATVTGGLSTTGFLTLNGPVTQGRYIVITDNSSAITTPTYVSMTEGTTTQFSIQTSSVTSSTTRQVTASLGGVTKSASITLNPD